MNRKLLTLDDLYTFYSTKKKSMKFSSEQNGEPIVVQVSGKISFEQSEDTEGLVAARLQACHTERNLNASSISFETMQNKLLPSFKNRPILAYIHEINGKPEFYGHNMHIDPDTEEIIYDEIPVGVIPETNNAKLEYDKENDRYNVIVDGWIYEGYTKAVEIIEREQECPCSVEIAIREMSYSAKEKCLIIEDGYFSGITILGKDENGNIVRPGMEGSNIKLKDFSESNNSMFSNMSEEEHSKLIDTLERLNTTLSEFNINKEIQQAQNFSENEEKGGNEKLTKLEELLSKYNKTQEDITFAIDGLSNEELEAQFAEMIDADNDDSEGTEGVDNGEGSEIEEPEVEPESEPTSDEPIEEFEIDPENDDPEASKFSKTFELSHDDIRCAIYNLLSAYLDEEDFWRAWVVEVFDDHFVYEIGCDYYGCKYIKDDETDTVALSGEPYKLYAEFLTEEEKAQVNAMRSNYSSIQAELNTYKEAELNAQREAVFNDEVYAEFVETESFKKIKENINTYSVDELRTACDLAFAKEVKNKGTFALNSEKKDEKKAPAFFAFAKQEKDSSFLDSLLKK